jgi:septal ring factor EnvC (AmiA/AmiB activator)
MVEFPEVLLKAAGKDSKMSGARFWALIGVAVLSIACAYVFPRVQASADRENKLEELSRQVQRLTSAQALTNAALAEVKRERQKDAQVYEALEDDRQKLRKQVEAQALEIYALRAEIPAALKTELPALKAKVASLEKGAKNLTADFVKSLLAAGATPTTPSYTSGPSKLKVPAELLKLSPDLAGEPRRCQLTFKGFQLVCDLISPGSQQ